MDKLRAVGADFAPAPHALALCQIVADLEADLARVGGELGSDESPLRRLASLERDLPDPSIAPYYPTEYFEKDLTSFVESLRAQLAAYNDDAAVHSDDAAVHSDDAAVHSSDQIDFLRREVADRYTRQLDVWRLLGRLEEEPVDFDGFVDQVIAADAIRRDAGSVQFDVGRLAQQLRDRRDDILGEVQNELSALLLTRRGLAETAATPPPKRAELEVDLLEVMASVDQAVRGLVERTARGILSEYATNLRRTQLQLATTEGLAQVIDDQLEIRTVACAQLAELLTRMKGGSIGIAGARGVGKSTIMRRFCTGREQIGERKLLPVMVSAPVVYDSRDFTLHLFAEVCRAAGAVSPAHEPTTDEDGQPRWPGWQAAGLGVAAEWLPFLGLLLMLAGIAGLILATVGHVNHLVVWGAAAMVASLLLTPRAYLEVRRRIKFHDDSFGLTALATYGDARGMALAAVFVGGGVLLSAGIEGGHLSRTGAESVGLLAAGALLVILARDLGGLMSRAGGRGNRERRLSRRGDALAVAASVRLEELRYQQTFTAGVTGKLALPIGIELGGTSERSLARHPMSFPEVVAGFSRFLTLAAQTHDVLIAIDELDKLPAEDATANEFLNDLKAAFGVPNTYFLVSVSEDAMSRFERRGLPFRDVFDSAFDEIVYVEPLVLAESQSLLARRVVGLPYIYSALCHVLAGGVPRDLVRTARRIVEVNERLGKPDELAPIVQGLMAADLKAKANGVQHTAIRLKAPDSTMNVLLEWLHDFRAASATSAELAAKVLDPDALMPLRVASQKLDEAVTPGLLGLASELNAYGYFVATVLEFFEQQLTEKDVEMAADGARESPRLELLAQARMGFSVSAQTAWRGIEAFRSEANLDPPAFRVPPAVVVDAV